MADPKWESTTGQGAAPAGGWETTANQTSSGWLGHLGHAVSNWWEEVNPIEQVKGLAAATSSPKATGAAAQAYLAQTADLEKQAEEAFKKGNYLEGGRHIVEYVLNGIPGLGGALNKAGNETQSGDVSGGVGRTLGIATNFLAPSLAKSGWDVAKGAIKARMAATETPTTAAGKVATAERDLATAKAQGETAKQYGAAGVEAAESRAAAAEKSAGNVANEANARAQETAQAAHSNAADTATEVSKDLQAVAGKPWEETSYRQVEDAAAQGDRHAQQVIEQMDAAETPGQIQQASVNLRNWQTGQQANNLYGRVENIAAQSNLPPVDTSNGLNALRKAQTEAKVGLKDATLNRELARIDDAISPTVSPDVQGGATGLVGNAATPRNLDYGSVRKIISQLDETIRTGRTGDNALIGDRAVGQLQQVKNGLEQDLQDFVQKSGKPELQTAQAAADEYYRQNRVPFKDRGLGKAATTDETDTIYQNFIKAGRGDRAQKFYDALDEKGQAAVRFQMVQDAVNRATDTVTGAMDPEKFLKEMDKVRAAHDIFFQGADRDQMNGLRNLMRQAIAADNQAATVAAQGKETVAGAQYYGKQQIAIAQSQYADAANAWAKDQTAAAQAKLEAARQNLEAVRLRYQRVKDIGKGALGGGLVGLYFGGVPAGLSAFLSPLLLTEPGQQFLFAASKLRPGSAMLGAMLKQLPTKVAKWAPVASTTAAGRASEPADQ